MKIAICDDDQILCHHLEEMLLELGRKEQTILQTELFFDGDTLWNYLKQGYRFDLLFLDIEMDRMDGIAVGRAIRNILGDEDCRIVYISSQESYAMDLFAVRPMDFLIKPVTEARLKEIWELYCRLSEKGQGMFRYQIQGNQNRIAWNRIMYFRVDNRKILLHTTDGRVIDFYGKMSEIKQEPATGRFVQISRSELVNYQSIEEYRGNEIVLPTGDVLSIVASRRKEVGVQIAEYMREDL